MSEWPDPSPDAQHKYPTYGLAVALVRELGSTGLSYVLDRSLEAPFDPETSRALDALRNLRERGASAKGRPWEGITPNLPRAVWRLIGHEATQALSAVPVENLVLELESRHPRISRTELLALSYVPTDLLSRLTRRNENIKTSRRSTESSRRAALNPRSDIFAEAIRQIREEARELGGTISGDAAIAKHQRSLSLSLDKLKERERRLGGGTHFSAWSFAVIPLTARSEERRVGKECRL